MKKLEREFVSSLVTLIFGILTIFIFIKYGAGLLFYIMLVIALLLGFYNTWLISGGMPTGARMEKEGEEKFRSFFNRATGKAKRKRRAKG